MVEIMTVEDIAGWDEDLQALTDTANKIKAVLATVRGITDLAVFTSLGQPTVQIEIDRARAARYGLTPGDINATMTTTTRGPNPQPPVALIDDPTHRLYRGLDPSLQPLDLSGMFGQDRVEVVTFAKPGRYLLICGIQGHFVNDGMYGFVTVLP